MNKKRYNSILLDILFPSNMVNMEIKQTNATKIIIYKILKNNQTKNKKKTKEQIVHTNYAMI